MAKDTKRSSSDRRAQNRRQNIMPVKLERRNKTERRQELDRREKQT